MTPKTTSPPRTYPIGDGHGVMSVATTSSTPQTEGASNTTPAASGLPLPAIIGGGVGGLVLIAIVILAVYIWYRRKYPVRMVLGKDFQRFSNPAYNTKRMSQLKLIVEDPLAAYDEPMEQINEGLTLEEEENSGLTNNTDGHTPVKQETSDDTFIDIGEVTDIATADRIQNEAEPQQKKAKQAMLVESDEYENFNVTDETTFEKLKESDFGTNTEDTAAEEQDNLDKEKDVVDTGMRKIERESLVNETYETSPSEVNAYDFQNNTNVILQNLDAETDVIDADFKMDITSRHLTVPFPTGNLTEINHEHPFYEFSDTTDDKISPLGIIAKPYDSSTNSLTPDSDELDGTDENDGYKFETVIPEGDKSEKERPVEYKLEPEIHECFKVEVERKEGVITGVEIPGGDKTEAEIPEGDKTEEQRHEGDATEAERRTEGDKNETERPEGDKTEAERPEVDKTETEITEGDKIEEQRHEGDATEAERRTEGDKNETERPEGDKTETEITEGDKTEAERRTEGDKTEAERPEGDKNETERPESYKTETEITEGDKTETEIPEGNKTEVEKHERDKTEVERHEGDKTEGEGHEADKTETDGIEHDYPKIYLQTSKDDIENGMLSSYDVIDHSFDIYLNREKEGKTPLYSNSVESSHMTKSKENESSDDKSEVIMEIFTSAPSEDSTERSISLASHIHATEEIEMETKSNMLLKLTKDPYIDGSKRRSEDQTTLQTVQLHLIEDSSGLTETKGKRNSGVIIDFSNPAEVAPIKLDEIEAGGIADDQFITLRNEHTLPDIHDYINPRLVNKDTENHYEQDSVDQHGYMMERDKDKISEVSILDYSESVPLNKESPSIKNDRGNLDSTIFKGPKGVHRLSTDNIVLERPPPTPTVVLDSIILEPDLSNFESKHSSLPDVREERSFTFDLVKDVRQYPSRQRNRGSFDNFQNPTDTLSDSFQSLISNKSKGYPFVATQSTENIKTNVENSNPLKEFIEEPSIERGLSLSDSNLFSKSSEVTYQPERTNEKEDIQQQSNEQIKDDYESKSETNYAKDEIIHDFAASDISNFDLSNFSSAVLDVKDKNIPDTFEFLQDVDKTDIDKPTPKSSMREDSMSDDGQDTHSDYTLSTDSSESKSWDLVQDAMTDIKAEEQPIKTTNTIDAQLLKVDAAKFTFNDDSDSDTSELSEDEDEESVEIITEDESNA